LRPGVETENCVCLAFGPIRALVADNEFKIKPAGRFALESIPETAPGWTDG
jgi:hypothetical protein